MNKKLKQLVEKTIYFKTSYIDMLDKIDIAIDADDVNRLAISEKLRFGSFTNKQAIAILKTLKED
jgi:hypothetical protein